jgi:hypothetical protein
LARWDRLNLGNDLEHIGMQPPDTTELLRQARELSSEPLAQMLSTIVVYHEDLFPSDRLWGDSLESQYRQWIERQLRPKLASLGQEGATWWQIMTKVDLFDHPEMFSQVLVVLAAWFFPGQEVYFATLALLVAIRRLGNESQDAP